MSTPTSPAASPRGIHHVRLTVTDIDRSKAFYQAVFGSEPAVDKSDLSGDADARQDPAQLYAGTVFSYGDQLLGLRPAGAPGDTFSSTRVGLDHVSLQVGSRDELVAAADRLAGAGIQHGEIIDIEAQGMSILSLQDPDDINLELVALT